MHVADISVWADPQTGRGCSIQVWDNVCDVELHAQGQRVLALACPTLDIALATADGWRPPHLPRRERRGIQLGDTPGMFHPRIEHPSQVAGQERRHLPDS